MHVYIIQNEVDGKMYVGQHVKENLNAYFEKNKRDAEAGRGNKKYLYRAMRKHGSDNFNIRSIYRAVDKIDLDNAEVAFIKFFGTQNDELGYNITAGGGGRLGTKNPHTEEWKLANSLRMKGRILTPEWKEKIGAAQRGRKFTDEHKAALRAGQLGKSKKRSPEHKLKIKENMIRIWAERKKEPNV